MSSGIFSTFSIVLLVLGLPERSSSSADTRPALKHEHHSKTAVQLKECYPKATRSISRVSVADLPSFMQNLMQTHCLILPSIAERMKHGSRKSTCVKTMHVHSMMSHGSLMLKACGSVALASHLIFFHQGSYNDNSLGTFQ
jgi:hypothetical protein